MKPHILFVAPRFFLKKNWTCAQTENLLVDVIHAPREVRRKDTVQRREDPVEEHREDEQGGHRQVPRPDHQRQAEVTGQMARGHHRVRHHPLTVILRTKVM